MHGKRFAAKNKSNWINGSWKKSIDENHILLYSWITFRQKCGFKNVFEIRNSHDSVMSWKFYSFVSFHKHAFTFAKLTTCRYMCTKNKSFWKVFRTERRFFSAGCQTWSLAPFQQIANSFWFFLQW